jgi:hypothetical protein
MEQPIQPNRSELVVLEDQLRECFGRVVYSHKAHEKTADIYLARLSRIKLFQILLSALTTGGLIVAVIGPPDKIRAAAIISAVLSTLLLAVNTYTKDVDLGQTAERHKETAARLWAIRESYFSLLTDIKSGLLSTEAVRSSRDGLQKALEEVYKSAPRTLDAAYAKAGIALQKKEELTFSEAEIDRFLPSALRRASTSQTRSGDQGGAKEIPSGPPSE